MKKIIYMFAFGIALLGFSGQASAAWNTYPSDCPNPLSIGNYTTGAGIQDGSNGCWTRKSISADPSQTINVAVYYDNTNNADANNVVISLNQNPAGSMSSKNGAYSFSGNLSSSVGSLNLSQVTANISNPETLTFSRAKWYKKTDASGISLPNGQTGYEAFNGGLNMGTIAKGDWGTILFSFTIGKSVTPPSTCTITNFTANPSVITSGASSTLSWNTNNCTSVSISPNVGGGLNASGSAPVSPTSNTTYTINASNSNGSAQPMQATVTVNQVQQTMTGTLTASSPSCIIVSGASTCAIPFTWNTQNPTGVSEVTHNSTTVGNGNNNSKSFAISNGTQSYYLYNTGTLLDTETVSASCASNSSWNGSYCVTSHTTQCLDSSAINYRNYESCIYNQTRCLDSAASNYFSYGSCIYNQIRCLDSSASNYLSYSSCIYNQVRCLDTSASNYLSYSSCIYNQVRCLDTTASNYLSYSSCIYNQVRCLDTSASNYLSYSSCIYNQVRCLDTTATNYLAYSACTYKPVYVNKNVVTTVATNITKNEAQVNGYITNSTYYNANTYFEYGTTVNLGSRTNAKSTIGNSNMNDYLTGLTPNTIYFYRAVGQGPDGISKGSIEIFRTLSDAAPKPIIIQGTTVVGTASPIMLKISNKYELIGEGDLVDYIVNYKNIGKQLLTHPMVQVVLPSNITLVNSSRGTYSVDTHTLSAQVEDLRAGDEGVIYLQGKVDSIPLNNSQIATTAILVYTTPNNTQENAMAYVINVPKTVAVVSGDSNTLGGNAFFAGLLSLGFIGWLIIILVILLIILIARSYSNNRRTSQETITHTTTH